MIRTKSLKYGQQSLLRRASVLPIFWGQLFWNLWDSCHAVLSDCIEIMHFCQITTFILAEKELHVYYLDFTPLTPFDYKRHQSVLFSNTMYFKENLSSCTIKTGSYFYGDIDYSKVVGFFYQKATIVWKIIAPLNYKSNHFTDSFDLYWFIMHRELII